MANALYTATWVSEEKAGPTSAGPNSLRVWLASDADATTLFTAIDGLISGDLMSITKELDRDAGARGVPTRVESQNFLAMSDNSSEHGRFLSVLPGHDPVGVLLETYGPGGDSAGGLLLFKSQEVVVDIRMVSH